MAAPVNFLSDADLLQVAAASLSHFFMYDARAAPASFLVAALALHVVVACACFTAVGAAGLLATGFDGAVVAAGADGVAGAGWVAGDWANEAEAETKRMAAAVANFMVMPFPIRRGALRARRCGR